MKKLIFFLSIVFLQGCTSPKSYENDIFPSSDAPWLPVNPEYFNKTEAQRIYEGQLK